MAYALSENKAFEFSAEPPSAEQIAKVRAGLDVLRGPLNRASIFLELASAANGLFVLSGLVCLLTALLGLLSTFQASGQSSVETVVGTSMYGVFATVAGILYNFKIGPKIYRRYRNLLNSVLAATPLSLIQPTTHRSLTPLPSLLVEVMDAFDPSIFTADEQVMLAEVLRAKSCAAANTYLSRISASGRTLLRCEHDALVRFAGTEKKSAAAEEAKRESEHFISAYTRCGR